MYPGSLPYAIPLFVIAAFTGGLSWYAFSKRAALAGAATFGLLMLALAEWALTYAFEFLAPSLAGKVLAGKLQYVGITSVGPLWLAFALHYTNHARYLTRRNQLMLSLPGLITFGLALTNEWHHQIWGTWRLDPSGFPALLIEGRGVWFWIFTVITYGFVLTGIVLYLVTYARAARVYRRQIGIMAVGALVLLAGNAIYIFGLFPIRGLDLTPFSLSVSGILFAIGFFRFGLLDLAPIAAQAVMAGLRDAVVTLDGSGRVIDLNPAARALYGVGDEAIGRRAAEALKPGEIWEQEWGADEVRVEVGMGDEEARRWLELTSSPLHDTRRRLLGRVAVLHDITHERDLLRMRDDLAAMIVHDLRNPLGTIHTALKVMDSIEAEAQSAEALPEEAAAYLSAKRRDAMDIARRSTDRALEMLDDLLDLGRLEGGQLPVNLSRVDTVAAIRTVGREMTPSAERRSQRILVEVPETLPPVKADAKLLDRVLRNLVGNGLKFTPSRGSVALAAQARATEVLFSITDTGPGISPAIQPRLFEKYARGAGPERGAGIGLAFCKLAVEAMGGRIWAENVPGKGAAFYFTVPRA